MHSPEFDGKTISSYTASQKKFQNSGADTYRGGTMELSATKEMRTTAQRLGKLGV